MTSPRVKRGSTNQAGAILSQDGAKGADGAVGFGHCSWREQPTPGSDQQEAWMRVAVLSLNLVCLGGLCVTTRNKSGTLCWVHILKGISRPVLKYIL